MIGSTISHYRILKELGRGGMGVVYEAEDTRLGRTVALKVLPTFVAASDHDKSRFEREARAAAAISHPRIATVYDFGVTDDGQSYLAMEFIRGETLSDMVEKAPLGIDRALNIGIQVAEGLQVAHEARVVHRDIKSSNVMVTERGDVKILDFGLAKLETASRLTQDGATLGTIAYMSPEQARGEDVDHRTDIWSLGVVLFEMIAGRNPFAGAYEQAIVYAILNLDPEPLTALRTGVPMELERIVNKCLVKNAALRYQHADDLIADLRNVEPSIASKSISRSAGSVAATPKSLRRARIPRMVLLGASIGMLAALAVVWFFNRGSGERDLIVRDIRLISVEDGLVGSPDIHPSGDIVAYTVDEGGYERVYYRQVSGGTPQPLLRDFPGDQAFPKYAPDGKTMLFRSGGTLFQVESLGGTPIPLATSRSGVGDAFMNPAWSPDGEKIAFTARIRTATQTGMDSLLVFDIESRKRSAIAYLPELHSPAWSPDGKWIAVVSGNEQYVRDRSNVASSSIWIVPAAGGAPTRVTGTDYMDMSPVFTRDGKHLLFISDRGEFQEIWSLKISRSGEAKGEPRQVSTVGKWLRSIALSPDGSFIVAEEVRIEQNIWSSSLIEGEIASSRDAVQITEGDQIVESVIVSPDQTMLAYDSNIEGSFKIFVTDLRSGSTRQITTGDAADFVYSWSPDGEYVAMHSQRNGPRDIFTVRVADGDVQPVVVDSTNKTHPRWSADGSTIAFLRSQTGSGRDLMLVQRLPDGNWGEERTLVEDDFGTGSMNPVENQLVFNVWGGPLYVTGLEAYEPRLILRSHEGIWWPVYTPDGSRIIFTDNSSLSGGSIWSVSATGGQPEEVVRMDGERLGKAYVGVSDTAVYYVPKKMKADLFKLALRSIPAQ